MGKRQHQKDKMYLTYTEWTTLYGGKKAGETSKEEENFRRLPFDHCCLSLQPFEHPYSDTHGNVFDLQPLLPFLKKYKVNPVTGSATDLKNLVRLNFHKNAQDEFHCPVLFKNFTKNSYIVTIATTGNVFSMEAVEQLNIKTKNWKDLISDEPFERKDIITLQDPQNLGKFNISKFHHVVKNLRVETEEEIAERGDPQARLRSINIETKDTLAELKRDYKESQIDLSVNAPASATAPRADKFNAAHYSTGAVAASFTSTSMQPELVHRAAIVHEDLVRYERVKKKGYIRILTNLGNLNLELYCDYLPKTCENFMKHCQNGYYDGTKFHRSIRNFMVQGGDPTGSGNGGKSIWGGKFEDEIRPNLSHTGRGVLSMANSGKNTNGSQFFITYRSCKHLDHKHSIFGKVVGGMETLNEMEKIEVDNKDKPIENIVFIKAQVFVDPYEEADEILAKERADELAKELEESRLIKQKQVAQKTLTVYKNGVGKYINRNAIKSAEKAEKTNSLENEKIVEPEKKKKKSCNAFNFSNW